MSGAMFTGSNIQVTGGTFALHNQSLHYHVYSSSQSGMDLLSQNVAYGAFHNSGKRFNAPKCHPGTRQAIIRRIIEWVQNFAIMQVFMWMNGPAGAGKSAIAQSVAEMCQSLGIYTASFFFSRHADRRNTDKYLAATLAYQICLWIPEMRGIVEETIRRDPLIFTKSLTTQLEDLIVGPMRQVATLEAVCVRFSITHSSLIIIDGLDESGDGETQKTILDALLRVQSQFSISIVILIASRPELEIRTRLSANDFDSLILGLPLGDAHQAEEDIYMFLNDMFKDIKTKHIHRRHLHLSWPGEGTLRKLVQKSSRQFIFAATVVKYIQSPQHYPQDRLETVLGLLVTDRPDDETPFFALDALYTQILCSVNRHHSEKVMEILAYLTLHDRFGPDRVDTRKKTIQEQLLYREGEIDLVLCDMHALLNVPEDDKKEIKFYHASFGDFLSDKSRSQAFHLDPITEHTKLACKYARLIMKKHDSVNLMNAFGKLSYHCKWGTLSPIQPDINLSELLRVDFFSLFLKHPDVLGDWVEWKYWLKNKKNASDADSDAACSLLHYHNDIEDNWLKPWLQRLHPETLSALSAFMSQLITPLRVVQVDLVVEMLEAPQRNQCNGRLYLPLRDLTRLFHHLEVIGFAPTRRLMRAIMYVIQDFVQDQDRSGPYFVTDEMRIILCHRLVDWAFQRYNSAIHPLRNALKTQIQLQLLLQVKHSNPIHYCIFTLCDGLLDKVKPDTRLAQALKEEALTAPRPGGADMHVYHHAMVLAKCLDYMKICHVICLQHADLYDIQSCTICGDGKKNNLSQANNSN